MKNFIQSYIKTSYKNKNIRKKEIYLIRIELELRLRLVEFTLVKYTAVLSIHNEIFRVEFT